MPYLADGSFSPNMPAGNVLAQPQAAPAGNVLAQGGQAPDGASQGTDDYQTASPQSFVPMNRNTGEPYVTRKPNPFAIPAGLAGGGRSGSVPKPGFQGMDIPTFPEYAALQAKTAGTDINTADDATVLGYAKDYAEKILPQHLLATGHTVNKEYMQSMPTNFQWQTAQQLPALRDIWKQQHPDGTAAPPKPDSDGWLADAAEGTGNVLRNAAVGAAASVPKTMASLAQLGRPIANTLALSGASILDAMGGSGNVAQVQQNIADNAPQDESDIADLSNTGDAFSQKYSSDRAKQAMAANATAAQADEANPNLNMFDRFLNSAGRSLASPSLIPGQVGEMLPALLGGGVEAKIAGAGIKAIAASTAPSLAKSVIEHLGAQGVERTVAAAAFNAPMAAQTLSSIGINAYNENFAKTGDKSQAAQASHDAMTNPAAALAVTAAMLPIGSARVLGGGAEGLAGMAARTTGQMAQGGVMSGASTAAGNIAAGRDVLQGVASSAGAGAGGMLPVAAGIEAFGAHGQSAKPGAPQPEATPGETPPPGAGAPTGAVQSAVDMAFEQHPAPAPAQPGAPAFTDPAQAQTHYQQASSTFRGDLAAENMTTAQIDAQMPAFNVEWQQRTGVDPATFGVQAPAPTPPGEPTAEAPSKEALDAASALAPDEELDVSGEPTAPAAQAAPEPTPEPTLQPGEVRSQAAAAGIPQGLHDRVAADLKRSLDRAPTAEEITKTAGHLTDLALSQPGIDNTIPRAALEEAVGNLISKKSDGVPDVGAINKAAREAALDPLQNKLDLSPAQEELPLGQPKDVLSKKEPLEDTLAKKDEVAPKDEGATLNNESSDGESLARDQKGDVVEEKPELATPEEQAKWQPLEDFYKKHTNVESVLSAMLPRLKSNYLTSVVKRILSNPYLVERLKNEAFQVHNPGDKATKFTQEGVGAYRRVRTVGGVRSTYRENRWGVYHPRDGVTIAGAKNKPSGPLGNGLHPLTVVHEALHAALAHIIRGIESGEIKDPKMIATYHELDGIRQALEKYADATTTDKATLAALKYGASNIHELVSVANTDPRVQDALTRIKMGTVNAWQRLMGIFNRLIGGTPDETPSLQRIVELSNRLIDYKPEGYTPQEDRNAQPLFNKQEEKEQDPFYSALNKSVSEAKGMPKKADATSWKQWLDGAQRRGEFKGGEREWMGVDQWLDEQSRLGGRSPEADHLAAGGLMSPAEKKRIAANPGLTSPLITREQLQQFVRDNQVKVSEKTLAANHFDTLTEPGPLESEGPPKFASYVLPGGENYREVLLTLPPNERTPLWDVFDQSNQTSKQFASEAEAREFASKNKNAVVSKVETGKEDYHSGHFDEPNILAHLRVNDRVGPDGEKILHVEEIQSDWHQAGRKQGYVGKGRPIEDIEADLSRVNRERNAKLDAAKALKDDDLSQFAPLMKEADALRVKIHELENERMEANGDSGKVPDAPLKKEWPMLAFKRALRMAVEGGYKKLTWTTGEQQAARYDLSKHVDEITAYKNKDGTYNVGAHKGDETVWSDGRATEKVLEDTLGKDVAKRIIEGGEKTNLSGLDLKFGGEGMKAFYDKMLPNEVNKYVKQWGGKVSETRLNPIEKISGGNIPYSATDLSVHSIDITPKMEQSVSEGQPLYSFQSDKVEENTPERILNAISVRSPKETAAIAKAQQAENTPDAAQAKATYIFDSLKPLTHFNEKMVAAGTPVSPKENVDLGARAFQGLVNRDSSKAQQQYITPFMNEVARLADKAGIPVQDFFNHVSAFWLGNHARERNAMGELRNGRLTSEAEAQRRAVTNQWAEGKLPDGQYKAALEKIVNAPGARVANRSPLFESGISDEAAQTLISKARKAGITPDVVAQLKPFVKGITDAEVEFGKAANRHSPSADARRSGYGYDWYASLKGFGEDKNGVEQARSSLGAFTSEYKAAGGRTSISKNPLLSSMQNMLKAASDVPENAFTKIVYNAVKKYGKQLGATIKTQDYEGAVRDAVAAGKGLDDVASVGKNENTIIHNSGDYRHAIEFAPDSPILKAIKSLTQVNERNQAQRIVGGITNLVARGATVLNPKFILWNAIWRDTAYAGAQVAMDIGPAAAAKYAANYWLKGGPFRGRTTYFQGAHPRNALERDQFALANPRNQFAQSLAELAHFGADLSFDNELSHVRNTDEAFAALQRASQSNTSPKVLLHAAVKMLDQMATSDIMTARVGAYEAARDVALKKLGKDATPEQINQAKSEAAMFSKRILDYQQKSDLSRTLSIAYPFIKVVLTQNDRLAASFKRPDGTLDYKKMALFTATGIATGAAYAAMVDKANPDYKKQKLSTLSTQLVIPVGDKLVTIPMAYGLTRLFLTPGMMLYHASQGYTSKEDALSVLRNTVLEALTPIKPPEASHNEDFHDQFMDLVQGMSPIGVNTLMAMERNKNYFGSNIITPHFAEVKGPHSEAGMHSTPTAWKWAAQELNKVSGGAIDVFPESLEYLAGEYGTGLANGFMRAAAMHDRATAGKDSDLQQAPFVPRVVSNDAKYYDYNAIKEKQEDLEAKNKHLTPEQQTAIKNKDPSDPRLSRQRTEQEETLLKQIDSSSRGFNKQRSAVYKNALLNPAARQTQLDAINKAQDVAQTALLKQAK